MARELLDREIAHLIHQQIEYGSTGSSGDDNDNDIINDNAVALQPRGGYDIDLFINRDKIDDYICPICTMVARNCVEVSCGNGHIFCKECIEYHFNVTGHTCPCDRVPNITKVNNDFVRRKILNSRVKCENATDDDSDNDNNNNNNNDNNDQKIDGCRWVGPLSQYDNHLRNCEYKMVLVK